MSKFLFAPFSILAGFLAGKLSTMLFERVWSLVDDQEVPKPEHRGIRFPKLVLALLLEGAIVRIVRGGVDRGAREAFTRLTGSWPGDERPEPQ